jgi:hypothetical protein
MRWFVIPLVLLLTADCAVPAARANSANSAQINAAALTTPPPLQPGEVSIGETPLEPELPSTEPAAHGETSVPEAPAHHYGRMQKFECEAELRSRGISFAPVTDARGVLAPVRLTAPVRGVTFHSTLPAKERATSPYEIMDCRLALALDDFAQILADQGIVEVIHFSAYRPGPKKTKEAIGHLGTRHEGALAIDIGAFVYRDGTVFSVEREFHGAIGAKTCPNTVQNKNTVAYVLHRMVCTVNDKQMFSVMLTPNYNRQHHNHFHFEVTPNVRWFYLR